MDDGAVRRMFGIRLAAWLKAEGKSKTDLAQALGVRASVVSAWTLGKSLPMPHCLRDLCIATGVSADWWLCLDVEPRPCWRDVAE